MNKEINGRFYDVNIVLYWGSDTKDIASDGNDITNTTALNPDFIRSLDIISTLSVPFVYGSFVYSDPKISSKLLNMIDMPVVHGRIMFYMSNGSNSTTENPNPAISEEEGFFEDVLITGIETNDDYGSQDVYIRVNFASEDIIKFTSNIYSVTTFDKDSMDKQSEKANEVIKKLFGSVKLMDKLDIDSFTVNTNNKIKYINSPNENLLTSLDYVYRKTFDDNFFNLKNCYYVRIRYNHITHKYEQWKYNDVGTGKLLSDVKDMYIKELRDIVTVELEKPNEPKASSGKFRFNTRGNSIDFLNNFYSTKFTDFNYLKNKFTSKEYEISGIELDHNSDFDIRMKKRTKIGNNLNSRKFKDVFNTNSYTTSNQNGSIYDTITDYIFNSSFYRVESEGSIGRKAGDEIVIKFMNSNMSVYENMGGDYLITAIDNRYVSDRGDGKPGFISIMDVQRPYIISDSMKPSEPYM